MWVWAWVWVLIRLALAMIWICLHCRTEVCISVVLHLQAGINITGMHMLNITIVIRHCPCCTRLNGYIRCTAKDSQPPGFWAKYIPLDSVTDLSGDVYSGRWFRKGSFRESVVRLTSLWADSLVKKVKLNIKIISKKFLFLWLYSLRGAIQAQFILYTGTSLIIPDIHAGRKMR